MPGIKPLTNKELAKAYDEFAKEVLNNPDTTMPLRAIRAVREEMFEKLMNGEKIKGLGDTTASRLRTIVDHYAQTGDLRETLNSLKEDTYNK